MDAPHIVCHSARARRRLVGVLSIGGVVGGVGFVLSCALFLYFEKTGSGSELGRDLAGLGIVVFFMSFFVGWMVVGGLDSWRASGANRRLDSLGVPARATIVGVKQTGGAVNDQPELELRLELELPGHAPYQALHCQVIEQLHLSRMTLGQDVPVLVDPEDHAWMRVDTARWESA